MAVVSGKYTVGNHTHTLASILSAQESQSILGNYSYIRFDIKNLNDYYIRLDGMSNDVIKFNSLKSSDSTESNIVAKYDETSCEWVLDNAFQKYVNERAAAIEKYKFTTSNNLFEDISVIECQLLMEKYSRLKMFIDLFNSRPSTESAGLVQLAKNSGLLVDSAGSLLIDRTGVQSTLVNGTNIKWLNDTVSNTTNRTQVGLIVDTAGVNEVQFKTINYQSILYRSDSEQTNFDLATKTELATLKSEIFGSSQETSIADLIEKIDEMKSDLTTFGSVISNIQKQVIDILTDMQSGLYGSSGNGGTCGSLICSSSTPVCEACDDITVLQSKSYYIKNVNKSMASCSVEPTPWFNFDAASLTPVTEDTYATLRFIVELRVNIDDEALKPTAKWRFPWSWCRQLPTASKPGDDYQPEGLGFGKDTVSLIEITAIWKCGTWNYFGKVLDQYEINCESPESTESELV